MPARAEPSGPWPGMRVLGVFAHPDDEAFAAGGLLAMAAQRGAAVTIACASRGEQGARAGAADSDDRPLAEVRAAELTASCRALGAGPPVFLDLPDGALDRVDAATGQTRTARVLAAVRPHLVVTMGPDGAYGHLDHLACTRWVRAAVAALAPDARPRLLLAVFPAGMFAPVWRRLRRIRGVPIAPDLDASMFGVAAADAQLRLDIDAVAGQKRAAMAAHRSQLPGGDPLRLLAPALTPASAAWLLQEEWYVHADGPPLPPGARGALAGLEAVAASTA